jgi:acid stress-induced BolA-like protein IbaG/YrbA
VLDPKQIEAWISAGLPCAHLAVAGDGQHFEAVVVSAEFEGLNRVKRQQRVYQTVLDKLNSGELHALSLQTLTPEEWKAARG